ncbi:leucine-rich repeat transmembrane neuronal protein 2-like isoform X2 [Chironomus tepperi]|uniref:leucine-rich repeat transmembrane neuronal protein 2-like isoform X2 n=1 Tax=Chironomus tepperi TaxID=113505 RepID=UPI00391EEDD2
MEILKSLLILWCSIGLISGANEKEYECTVRHNTTFSQFEDRFTTCVLKNVNYISGKGLKFSNSTNDIAYNKLKITFIESNVETVPNMFYTFTNLEVLEMNQVGLRNIFQQSFQHASNLRVFHAYENKITTLDAYSFVEAIKLEYLDLSHNKIANINVEAFKGLSKLKELSLIDNRISIIDEQTFEPLKALTWIWLDRNEIKIISLSLFVNNLNLKGMNFNNNKISAFSTILLDKLPQLRFLFLSGNNCTSQNFINTVIQYNANIKKELSSCYAEYRSIVPNEEEKYQLKNVLRDAEKANAQCETDKAALLERLETTRQQLANLQYKNEKPN